MKIELDNREPVALTKAQRLVLVNQYQIMMLIDKKNASDYESSLEAVRRGYAEPISELFEQIFDGLSDEQCSLAIHSMSMYEALQSSYKALGEKESAKAGVKKSDVTFLGFSGNEETSYMAYCRYVVDHEQRFDYLETSDRFNSHFPMKERYAAMLVLWEGELGGSHKLTGEQMKRLLNTR